MSIREPYVGEFKKVSLVQFKKDMLKYFGEYFQSAYANEGSIDYAIKSIYDNIHIPTRGTYGAAGYDFYLPYSVPLDLRANYVIIPTGIKCEIKEGYSLILTPRSSAGIKNGFRLRNTIGVIDSDYYNNESNEGHIMLSCQIDSYPIEDVVRKRTCDRDNYTFSTSLTVNDRVVQGIFLPYGIAVNDEDSDVITKRQGGSGSTGV